MSDTVQDDRQTRMNMDSLNEMKQKHQCRTYIAKGKSWDGSDDEKELHVISCFLSIL